MSLKLSATYRIKPQTSSDLEPSLQEGRADPPGPIARRCGGRWSTELRNPRSANLETRDPSHANAPNLSARDGAGGLSGHRRLRQGRRDFLMARSRRRRRRPCVRRSASRLTPGRRPWTSWASMTPSIVIAAILQRGDEIKMRRRLSARPDRKGAGRGVFARAGADGAVARQGRKGGARAEEGGVMAGALRPQAWVLNYHLMVASQLMEKRRPTYDLDAIKQAIGSVDRLAITTSALRDASASVFDRGAIVETIHSVDRRMFVKSMTTFADHRLGRTSITCRCVDCCSM